MRRPLAILLIALLATPCFAGRAVVVQPGTTPGWASINSAIPEYYQRRLAVYRTLGIDFDALPNQALKTEWARTLVVSVNGEAKTYVAGIMNEFTTAGSGAPAGASFVPDSLLMQARWPTGPWVLFAPPNMSSTSILADRSSPYACSTGFGLNTGPSLSNSNLFQRNFYVPGSSWYWRSFGGGTGHIPNALTPHAAGVWRTLVSENSGGWTPYAMQAIAPTDWDSSTVAVAETLSSVARYKKNGAGPPIIITATGWNAAIPPYGQMLQSLALADSAASGELLFQTHPGPVRFNIQIGPLAATGSASAQSLLGLDDGIGPRPGDSTAVKATLSGYNQMGLKATILLQTNADTVAALATQYEWVRKLYPLAKVSPFDKAGVSFSGGVGDSKGASATAAHDVYGASRERSLFPAGETDPRDGCDCATSGPGGGPDTSSVYCGVTRQFAFLEGYFGKTRVDHVIACPLEDFSPVYFNRSRGSIDSLKWCLWLAGVRGVRVGNMTPANDVGSSATNSPRGYWSTLRVEDVIDPANGRRIGRIPFMPSRDFEQAASTTPPAHDLPTEFLDGLLCGDWYTGSRSPIYVNGHNFFSRTVILELSGASLGGTGAATGGWRYGYWYARTLWAICKAANRFGRTVIEPSYGDETAAWIISSGIR